MDIVTTKLTLMDLLSKTNKESVLEKIKSIFDEEYIAKTVGYTILSEPIDLDIYNQKLEKSENDYLHGKVKSHQTIKKKYSL